MKKYYINLTEQERSQIIHSLLDKKNALMAQGRYRTLCRRYGGGCWCSDCYACSEKTPRV